MQFDVKRGFLFDSDDVEAILEVEGEHTKDKTFMDRVAAIARQSLSENSDDLKEILGQSDDRFASTKGLLARLDVLDQASSKELSQMLFFLIHNKEGFAIPETDEMVVSYEHVPAVMAYIRERIKALEAALERITARESVETDFGRKKAAQSEGRIAKAELDKFKGYLHWLNDYEEYEFPQGVLGVPDEKK